jgi:hypothetical protein
MKAIIQTALIAIAVVAIALFFVYRMIDGKIQKVKNEVMDYIRNPSKLLKTLPPGAISAVSKGVGALNKSGALKGLGALGKSGGVLKGLKK